MKTMDFRNKTKKSLKAFSLMELLVVIVILGLLAAVVLPNFVGKSEEAKRKLTCVQMKNLSETLKMFKIDNGRYPTTQEGLDALVSNPDGEGLLSYAKSGYLEDGKVPKDPWNNDYIYVYDEDGSKVDLISVGSDGKEGGKNEGEDIYFSKCN